jgi:hypothetical protein
MKGLLPKIRNFKINIKRLPQFIRYFNFTTENKSGTNTDPKNPNEQEKKEGKEPEQEKEQSTQSKNVKHIYKQKNEHNPDVVYDEAHAYREGFDDGYYVRQSMSYVYYEYPGKTSESGGKSDEKKEKKERTNQEPSQASETEKTQSKQSQEKPDKNFTEDNKKI